MLCSLQRAERGRSFLDGGQTHTRKCEWVDLDGWSFRHIVGATLDSQFLSACIYEYANSARSEKA